MNAFAFLSGLLRLSLLGSLLAALLLLLRPLLRGRAFAPGVALAQGVCFSLPHWGAAGRGSPSAEHRRG